MINLRKTHYHSWPSNKPVWTIAAFCLAVVAIIFSTHLQREFLWSPLERYWYDDYFISYAFSSTDRDKGYFKMLAVQDRYGNWRMAMDADVVEGETQTEDGTTIPLALSEEDQRRGWTLVLEPRQEYTNAHFQEILAKNIYHGHTLMGLYAPSFVMGFLTLISGLMFAIPLDRERTRVLKYGRHVRGPEILTAAEFNRRNQSDGIGFPTLEPRTYFEWLFRREGNVVRIPYAREARHFMVIGDTGNGKGVAIRALLRQIAARGESAIVYDPALEYVQEFYNPDRGDQILNPLDKRTFNWALENEITHEAEALAIAMSWFPDDFRKQEFFNRSPREILAHLLAFRPTAQQLAQWLSSDDEIDARVQGSEVASLIAHTAPQQRQGVLSELKLIGKALKLLPGKETATSASWSARQWARNGRGWLFITSTPETRDRLAPLIGLWLDMLVLRLMGEGIRNADARRVWFVLDEVASFRKLPQLHTALAENRKSNCPVVLGFQGRSQIEAIYGQEAEAMLSQPATKIFLGTSEAKAAKWISDTVGEVEVEILRQTRSEAQPLPGQPFAQRETWSQNVETRVERVLLASQVGGLPQLHGYLKHGNYLVPLKLPYLAPLKLQPGFLPRENTFMQISGADGTKLPPAKPVQSVHDNNAGNRNNPANQNDLFFK